MNILSETKSILAPLNYPFETGVFKSKAPDTYLVLIPLSDSFPLNADDKPQTDEQELRITIYSKTNYLGVKKQITVALLDHDFYITNRTYNGYETETGYYQYTIDIAKNYELEEIT